MAIPPFGTPPTPNATATVKGKVKLAGALSGTADLPAVLHSATSGQTADDHHTKLHGSTHNFAQPDVLDHNQLGNGADPNGHHNRDHSIIGTTHTAFPGGTSLFLRADGTFAAPPSGGSAAEPSTFDWMF